MLVGKFIDINGVNTFIGTDADLYNIIRDNMGADFADYVTEWIKDDETIVDEYHEERNSLEDEIADQACTIERYEEFVDDYEYKFKRIKSELAELENMLNEDGDAPSNYGILKKIKYIKTIIEEILKFYVINFI